MRTSELAGRSGVNPETLRYYERRGLLDEPPRTPGGYRDFPDTTVRLLGFIKRALERLSEVTDLPVTQSREITTDDEAAAFGMAVTRHVG